MFEVKYTAHLELRLQTRKILYKLPRVIYRLAEERYFDISTKHNIAIKHVKYGKKTIPFMIAYDERSNGGDSNYSSNKGRRNKGKSRR